MNKVRGCYDVPAMQADMRLKGWLPLDLARKAKVSHTSVGRFLRGERQTARMAMKLAKALGSEVSRYLIASRCRRSTESVVA
jgi:transcriptional regulator with XRE-family HTH domain